MKLPGTQPVVVVSPHLDDAVLGCGQLLARHPGSTAVTVFAARSPNPELTEWDRAGGFGPGDDVVSARRSEDAAALALLQATPVWLDFLEDQYQDWVEQPPPTVISRALEETLAALGPTQVLFPLGLFHYDHRRVHEACRLLLHGRRRREAPEQHWEWFCYQDGLYGHVPGVSVAQRLEEVAATLSLAEEHLDVDDTPDRKRQAIGCYHSQVRALTTPGRPGLGEALAPERYWRAAAR